jgi:flavin reductase (DIM6/NTAB) family NADH-FMN oxidoreductase RutF
MEVNPTTMDWSGLYRLLSGTIIPRPIAWITTLGPDGTVNLAPYSFFQGINVDPPVVVFAPGQPTDGERPLKDTAANALDAGEFVVNLVAEQQAETMVQTSDPSFDRDRSELEYFDVEAADAAVVDPPRVAESPVSFECELYDTVELPSNVAILGEVVHVHLDDAVTTDGVVDFRKLPLVGRLTGGYYARIDDRFQIPKPDPHLENLN